MRPNFYFGKQPLHLSSYGSVLCPCSDRLPKKWLEGRARFHLFILSNSAGAWTHSPGSLTSVCLPQLYHSLHFLLIFHTRKNNGITGGLQAVWGQFELLWLWFFLVKTTLDPVNFSSGRSVRHTSVDDIWLQTVPRTCSRYVCNFSTSCMLSCWYPKYVLLPEVTQRRYFLHAVGLNNKLD